MFCNPLDIPDDVIAAQEAGELVIFVGAGVSKDGASDLPLFEGLTDQIGAAIGKTRGSREDFDVLLGDWQDNHGARVHEAARAIIANPQSQPNEAHRLLLRLFKKPEHVRIVTTNYDRHFTTVASEFNLQLPVYRAPALPLGDDFHGIVFLHGSVEDKPERLVLTDADFGRAYLAQGWARTFLQTLYTRFHVLFVGYRHADILLTYLARGLPARDRRKRHAVQSHGDYTRWKQLGIDVIPYALPHSNLEVGLARWVQLSSLQPQDVRERVRQIVDGVEGPSLVIGGESSTAGDGAAAAIQLGRDGEDFLIRAFRDPVSTGWFTERARNLRWITWLLDSKLLPLLSDPVPLSGSSRVSSQLIGWAVERLLTSRSPETMEVFVKLGGGFGPDALWWAVRTLVVDANNLEVWESPYLDDWLVAIRHGCGPRMDHSLIPGLIAMLVANGKGEHALGLFSKLLHVRVEWSKAWASKQAVSQYASEAKLACAIHDLREAWTALQPLRGPATDDRLFRMLTGCVEELYVAHGPLTGRLDPVAGMRIVVDEPRGGHDPHDAEDFVPVMLLELLKARGASSRGVGEELILLWLTAPQVGWHRFAFFALRVDTAITPSRKLEIILHRSLVYPKNWQLQHDPQSLVVTIYGSLDQAEKRRLLTAVAVGPKLTEREDRTAGEIAESERSIRNGLLQSLAYSHLGDPEIAATLSEVGLELPPAFPENIEHKTAETEFGFVRDIERSPRSVKELLSQTVEAQFDYFLDYQGETQGWSGPNRAGLLGAIVAAAEENLEWAQALITSLIARGITQGDLWDRLAWGLNWHTKEATFRRWFLIEVMPCVDPTGWAIGTWRAWTHHLFQLGDQKVLKELSPDEWEVLLGWSLRAWHATRSVWSEQEAKLETHDALTSAINHPAGRAVEFWLTYVSHLRHTQPTMPFGWPERLQEPIGQLMVDESDIRLIGLAILGQNLSFVRYAFPVWTPSTLYPLLDTRQHPRLGLCLWSAWLHYGRLSAELATELPPFFEQAHHELLTADKDTPRHFITYLALLATSPFPPADALRWLRSILGNATPTLRAWWNSEVARCLREASPERQNTVWATWAREHLRSCQLGVFGAATAEEFAEFLHWPIAFAAAGDEALTLVQALHVHPVKRLDVIYDLKLSGVAKQHPDFTPRYLRWLLETVAVDRYGYYGLDDVIGDLAVTATNFSDLKAVAARLLALGCTPEAEALFSKTKGFTPSVPSPNSAPQDPAGEGKE